jgi:hypothetical protein
MNFRRIIQLTSSLAAALTLTACGGGDTGPQWVQDLKDTIVYGELQLPVGTVYSPCSALTISRPQSQVIVTAIEKTNGAYYITTKEEVYDDLGCSDDKKLFTLTYPRARLTYVGDGEDSTASLAYQRVRSVSEGGNLQIDIVEDAPVTFTPISSNQVRVKFTSGAFLEYDQTTVFPAGATGTDIFGQDERSLYRGDQASAVEQVGDDSFPSKLNTNVPFRPYRFFSITPGTYANGTATTNGSTPDCDAITLPGTGGGKTYGYIVKVVAAPIDQDYRPEISLEFDYFADLNCNDRLVTVKSPPILLETVGNGIDPTIGVTYRKVLQLQQAGAFTATATSGDARVTVTPDLVTFVNDGVTIPIGASEASTSAESLYFNDASLYQGDTESIDPATGFPSALLLEFPFFLVN